MSQFNFRVSSLFHKIAVTTLAVIVFLVIMLGIYMVKEKINVTKDIEKSLKKSMKYGHDVSFIITESETRLKEMSAVIEDNYDISNANDPEKLNLFLDKIDNAVKTTVDDEPYFQGAWFQINPLIAKLSSSYFSWYFRGEVKRVSKFKESSYRSMTQESDPYYFNAVKAGKMVMSGIYKDADLQIDLVTISEPVYFRGILIGVAGIDFSIEEIKSIFAKAKKDHKEINLYLFNSQKNFIAGTDEPSEHFIDFTSHYLSDKRSEQYTWYNDSLVFELLLSQDNFSLVIEIPSEVIYSNIKHAFNMTFALVGFLILMLIVVLLDRYKLFNYAKKTSEQLSILSGGINSIPDQIAFRNKQGMYIACNESYAKFFNNTKKEIYGNTVRNVLPKLLSDEITKEDQEVFSSRNTIEKEQEFTGKKLTYLDTIKAPLYSDENELIGILDISRDITNRKKMEMELLDARKKAEALTMAKTNFLRNMTHEILTPINGVAGFLELLNDTRLDLEQADYVKEARTSSEELLNLTKQILEFSKIQDGQLVLDKAKMNIRETIGEIISANIQAAEKRRVVFNVKITHTTPTNIIADKLRIKQVLNIFIGNAIKYTGPEGEVLLEISAVNTGNNKARISFKVSDTGKGISNEDINKIKEAFEKYDLETTKKYGGIGLGLTIANRLINIMGAEIDITSQKGKGSVFSFAIEEDIEQKDCCLIEDTLKNVEVLLIEKNKTTSDIIRYYLEEFGCTAHIASTENEGIRLFKSNTNFSVAIIGNDLNYFDYAGKLKKIRPIPMILLCDNYRTTEAAGAKETGFAEILRKPALPNEIVETIQKAIRNDKIATGNTDCGKIDSKTPNELKILVVEDNETHSKMILKCFINLGLSVTDSVASGIDAIRLCKDKTYDLVIMDCQLPVMDGYEAARRIRNIGIKAQKTAIIGLTSCNLAGEREKCMNSGMDEFLAKPLDPIELIEKLNILGIYSENNSFKQAAHLKIAQDITASTGLKLENAMTILSEYKTLLPKLISEISSSIQKKEFKAIISPANSINEISPFLGMEKLSKLAEDIHNAANSGNEKACLLYLEEIRNCAKLLL